MGIMDDAFGLEQRRGTRPPIGRNGGRPVRRRAVPRLGISAALASVLLIAPGHGDAAQPVTSWDVPVLMYHRVAPDDDLRESLTDLVIRPRDFADQMRVLHEAGWTAMTAAALGVAMRGRSAVPDRTVVLTFDDGTQDVYTNAWPILRRYGFVGTFYLITARTRPQNRPWSYSMSQEQARDLAAGGNEIANHTRDHACLAGTTRSFAQYEISRGDRDIAGFIGHRSSTLAWPKGCVDSTAVQAAQDHGTFLAFTTQPGCHETLAGRLVAPRVRVHRTTTAAQLLRLVEGCR